MEKSLEIGREGLVGVKVIGLHWEGVKTGQRDSRGSGTELLETKVREMVSKARLKRQAVRCAPFGGPGSLEDRARDEGMKWFRFLRRKFSKCW